MPQDPKMLSLDKLAKYGYFEELRLRAAAIENPNLAYIFDRAVTDFRTVKRKPGHQSILRWCIDQGLDFDARAGWMNQSVVCLAAQYGNNEIIDFMSAKGLPDNPFVRASVGDLEFLRGHATRHRLSDLKDVNRFNLLFYCAGSGLGRSDESMRKRLAEVCRHLLDHAVSPSHEADSGGMRLFPAFLCAWWGGNEEVMSLLLDHTGLRAERFHGVLEFSLEPHQRSAAPFYRVAEVILRHGFNLNDMSNRSRTLLHGSANRGALEAVRWLLMNGADPNASDVWGRTPLHVCAERNTSTSAIKLLITVSRVSQELLMFAVVSNLVRVVMLEASRRQGVPVDRISFADALRWPCAARPGEALPKLVVNPDRADRVEPRVRKRRPKQYPLMTKPRSVLHKSLLGKNVAA